MTTILTFELVVFACALFILVKLRNEFLSSISIVDGLTAYVTPSDKDFEVLEKTSAKPKTNMKGEPRKNEKQKAKTKIQFPMRTMTVNKEMLSYVQEFFETYDFILLFFLAVLIQFSIISVMAVIPYEPIQKLVKINVTFYVIAFLLLAIMLCLVKDSFNLGILKLSNQTQMQLFMAVKAFLLIWVVLINVPSSDILDMSLESSHKEFNTRLNQALDPFGIHPFKIPFEFSVALFSLLGATISFCIVNEQVQFAHFFFEFSESEDQLDTEEKEGDDVKIRTSKKMQKLLSVFVYTNFLTPIFLILLYINPVIKQTVVPDLISSSIFQIIKYLLTLLVCILRCLTFREEVQFSYNESYSLIQKLVQNKNEKLFTYVKYRIKENFLKTWYTVFQHLSNIMIPTCLIMLRILRDIQILQESKVTNSLENSSSTYYNFQLFEAFKKNETISSDAGQIDLFAIGNREILSEMVREISQKGLIPHSYFRDIFEFILFWYFFASFLTNSFALLYYRKFRQF